MPKLFTLPVFLRTGQMSVFGSLMYLGTRSESQPGRSLRSARKDWMALKMFVRFFSQSSRSVGSTARAGEAEAAKAMSRVSKVSRAGKRHLATLVRRQAFIED